MKFKLDQRGVGLIQIIVGLAITSVTATVIMQSMTQTFKTQQTNIYKQEMSELTNKISIILADSEACQNTLGGMDPDSTPNFLLLRDKSNAVVWDSTTSTYGSLRTKIREMKLEDFAGASDGAAVVDGALGSTNLTLYFESKNNTQYANQFPMTKVKLNVHTDLVTGRIVDCFTSDKSLGLLWMRESIASPNINHMPGWLGIGTDSPEVALDVVGGIIIQNVGGEKFKLDVEDANFRIEVNIDKPFIFQNIAQARRADIDMGTLQMTRHLYLGNTALPCNVPNQGALRYNGAVIQYCNSSSWKSLIYE